MMPKLIPYVSFKAGGRFVVFPGLKSETLGHPFSCGICIERYGPLRHTVLDLESDPLNRRSGE